MSKNKSRILSMFEMPIQFRRQRLSNKTRHPEPKNKDKEEL